MQIQVEKRYTNGLSFLVSYNLSQMMSNTNSGFTSFASRSLNKDNQKSEWSIDNNDQTTCVNIAATYELPFGKGQAVHEQGRRRAMRLGRMADQPAPQLRQRHALQVTVAGDPLGNGRQPAERGSRTCRSSSPTRMSIRACRSLNAAAFSDPGPWAIGNEPRYLSGMRNPVQATTKTLRSQSTSRSASTSS